MMGAFFVAAVCLTIAWELRFQERIRPPMSLAIAAARRSTEVNRRLGTPVKASLLARGHFIGDRSNGTADFTFELQGPLGRGTLAEWAQEGNGRWKVCGLDLKTSDNPKSITLVDEATTRCERE